MTDRSTGESMKDTAKTEAQRLADEARQQGRNVYGEVGDRVRSEADSQSKRAAGGIRSLSSDLEQMAAASDGPASSLVREGSARMAGLADRLEIEGIDAITYDIRDFARRRPGMFLAATFGAGLLAARVAKNVDTRSITEGSTEQRRADDRSGNPTYPGTGSVPIGSASGMELEADPYGDREAIR